MFTAANATRKMVVLGLAACAVFIGAAYPGNGQASPLKATAPSLGTAAGFAVLGGSTVTNTGPSTVNGNLGVSPGSAVTGFPPGSVTGGTIHKADGVAGQAQTDATAAYIALAGQHCNQNLTGQDLGGKALTAGVYCFSSSAQLTGGLTLNGQGDPNAVFIFQIGSTLTTASVSAVLLINGATSCNVFWQVGSSATLGTSTTFSGSILALTNITLTTRAGVNGRTLARNGAVTMDTINVASQACAAGPVATGGTATSTSTVPQFTPTSPPPIFTYTPSPPTSTTVPTTTTTGTPTTVTPITTPGVPLAASALVSRLTIQRRHGTARLRWFSAARVRGFDVYNGATRLNRRPVTSRTHWYTFSTRRAVNRLSIRAIPHFR